MLGDLSDWIFAALPWKVQVGYLTIVVAGIVLALLWAHYG